MTTLPPLKPVIDKYRTRISLQVKNLIENLDVKTTASAIKKQFYPQSLELEKTHEYFEDPLEEHTYMPHPQILHKYPHKFLWLITNECPVFCRYCTRKRRTLVKQKSDEITQIELLTLIEQYQINEVIFSGGDPFFLNIETLFNKIYYLKELSQVHYIRFHSRCITTLTHKFNENFWSLWKKMSTDFPQQHFSIIMHINRVEEINSSALQVIKKFQERGVKMAVQAVLLKGVNDKVEHLHHLAHFLLKYDIHFYYLHQIDQVAGSQHFFVSQQNGIELMQQLRKMIPPHAMPRYVKDSKAGKINLYY